MSNEKTKTTAKMSRGKWVFIVFTLLIATNIITFGWTTFRYRSLIQQREETISNLEKEIVKQANKQKELKASLERLQVWESFISLQQDLGKINSEINNLNFGNAIKMIESLKKRISNGDLGKQFEEHKNDLTKFLDKTIQELKNKKETARNALIDFNEYAFRILAGISPLSPEKMQQNEKRVQSEQNPSMDTHQPATKKSPPALSQEENDSKEKF